MKPHCRVLLTGLLLLNASPCWSIETMPQPITISAQDESSVVPHLVPVYTPDLSLSCQTETPWFFCMWHSPRSDKQCAIQNGTPKNVCEQDERVQLIGDSNFCDVHLNEVSISDHGEWLCLVNDADDFNTTKQYVQLTVTKESSLEWGGGYQDVLEVHEGEEVTLTCISRLGYPPPIFSWEGPKGSSLQFKERPPKQRDAESHLVDSSASLDYLARKEDTNQTIRCSIRQDKTNLTRITKTIQINLKVREKILPVQYTWVNQTNGLIVGISTFLILILLFILLSIACQRKRGHKTEKEDVEEPLWRENEVYEPKNIRYKQPWSNIYKKSSKDTLIPPIEKYKGSPRSRAPIYKCVENGPPQDSFATDRLIPEATHDINETIGVIQTHPEERDDIQVQHLSGSEEVPVPIEEPLKSCEEETVVWTRSVSADNLSDNCSLQGNNSSPADNSFQVDNPFQADNSFLVDNSFQSSDKSLEHLDLSRDKSLDHLGHTEVTNAKSMGELPREDDITANNLRRLPHKGVSNAKSMGHLPNAEVTNHRRRRQTDPGKGSTKSIFDCPERCFTFESDLL